MEALSEYGSDALRMGLIASRSAGQNQAFSSSKVVAGRNFANKLWNMTRFIEGKLGDGYILTAPKPQSQADHWIMRELSQAAELVGKHVEQYRFSEAAEVVYHSIWSSLADWYIEASKQQLNADVLAWALDCSLRMAHPFLPFVTETIWQTLPWYPEGTMLIRAPWPEKADYSAEQAVQFDSLRALVTEIRFVTNELPGTNTYPLLVRADDSHALANAELVMQLAKVQSVEGSDDPKGLRVAVADRDAWLAIDAKTLEEHQSNLEIRIASTHKVVASLQARLATPSYVEKAPAHLVEETKRELEEKTALVERLQQELTSLAN